MHLLYEVKISVTPLNNYTFKFCILSFSTKKFNHPNGLADREKDVPPRMRHVAPAGGAAPTSAMTLESKPHLITLSSLNLMLQMRLMIIRNAS